MKEKLLKNELHNNLESIELTIDKVFSSNKNLEEENSSLINKIEKLESHIDTLIDNNRRLTDLLKNINKEEKLANNDMISSKMGNFDILNIIKRAINSEDEKLKEHIIKSVLDLISDLLTDKLEDVERNEMLEIIGAIYNTLDEEELVEFTDNNHLSILRLIEFTSEKPKDIIIKIARILYSIEEFIGSDNYMVLLNFDELDTYTPDTTIIDLLLINIHFLDPDNKKDIGGLWSRLKNSDHIECKDIKNYFESRKELEENNLEKSEQCIESMTYNMDFIDTTDEEIKNTIRVNSYTFMLRRLEEIVGIKKKEKEKQRDEQAEKTKEVQRNLKEDYFDHRLYMMREKSNKCPFDSEELTRKTIVEKIYKNKHDLSRELNPMYEEIKVFYCSRCEEYFLQPGIGIGSKTRGCINFIQIKETKFESSKSTEYDHSYNDDSILSRNGYSTFLNDNARWKILSKLCSSKQGRHEVLKYLTDFVYRFGRQKNDHSRAISIWEKDIKKIKRTYKIK